MDHALSPPTCIVIEHFITPTHDMYLTEYTHLSRTPA